MLNNTPFAQTSYESPAPVYSTPEYNATLYKPPVKTKEELIRSITQNQVAYEAPAPQMNVQASSLTEKLSKPSGNLIQDSLNPVYGASIANFDVTRNAGYTPISNNATLGNFNNRINEIAETMYTNAMQTPQEFALVGDYPVYMGHYNGNTEETAGEWAIRKAKETWEEIQKPLPPIDPADLVMVNGTIMQQSEIERAAARIPYVTDAFGMALNHGVQYADDYLKLWFSTDEETIRNGGYYATGVDGNLHWFYVDPETVTTVQRHNQLMANHTAQQAEVDAYMQRVNTAIETGEVDETILTSIKYATILGNMTPMLALSLLPVASTMAAMGYLFTSSGGNAYAYAIEKGATQEQALLYSALTGAKEVVIEMYVGGAINDAGGFADDLLKPFMRVATNAVGEGAEELVSLYTDPFFGYLTGVEDEIVIPTVGQGVDTFFTAFNTSLLLGANGTMNADVNAGANSNAGMNSNVINKEQYNLMQELAKLQASEQSGTLSEDPNIAGMQLWLEVFKQEGIEVPDIALTMKNSNDIVRESEFREIGEGNELESTAVIVSEKTHCVGK